MAVTSAATALDKCYRDAILDFLVGVPSIFGKAMTQTNLKKGFLENGMIDSGSERCPDIYQVIKGTTRRDVANSQREMNNLLARNASAAEFADCREIVDIIGSRDATAAVPPKLVTLIRYQIEKGYVPDTVLILAGVTPDTDFSTGEVISRDAPITIENRQRAKTLTHDAVKAEREAILSARRADIISKHTAEQVARSRLLEENAKCESLLHDVLLVAAEQRLASTPQAAATSTTTSKTASEVAPSLPLKDWC